jgi:hypothetical protein
VIESLYIMDSSGLCFYSAPLAAKEHYDPDLISGFMVAQQKSFRQFFGESTKVLSLQKRQILLQSVDLKDRNLLIAIAHEIGNPKEEKISRGIIESLVTGLKSRKDKIFQGPESSATYTIRQELGAIVDKTLKSIRCIFFIKGFLAVKDECERTNSPTGNRPCDFYYAVKKCERYTVRETSQSLGQ